MICDFYIHSRVSAPPGVKLHHGLLRGIIKYLMKVSNSNGGTCS